MDGSRPLRSPSWRPLKQAIAPDSSTRSATRCAPIFAARTVSGSPITCGSVLPPTSSAPDSESLFEFAHAGRAVSGLMSLFRELTEGLPRQGPGSSEATLRALGLTRGLPEHPKILDVGCGPGAQTIDLARATNGEIVAVDIRQRFLDELTERARDEGV